MSRRGWILFAFMSVIWGIPYLMIKVAVGSVSVPMVVFARTALGALVLLPFALRPGQFSQLRRHWRPLLAFAGLEIIVPWFLLSDAERHVSSSMAGLLIAAVPIIALVAARLIGDTERLSLTRIGGLGVGLAGVAVLAAQELSGGNTLSMVELLVVAICYATAPLIAAHKLADVPALPMSVACLGLAALIYTPPAILTWPDTMPSWQVLAALGGLAVVCTGLAFLGFFALIREVGAARATVITYVNPAVAVAAGVALLHEPLTGSIIAAFVLILGGSVLATSRQRPNKQAPAQSTHQPPRLVGELS